MDKIRDAMLAAVFGVAFASGAAAQMTAPRDSSRPAAETPADTNASPRDGQDRRDAEQDRRDADLAIERDKCGELSDDAKERCIQNARMQRDSLPPSGYRSNPARRSN